MFLLLTKNLLAENLNIQSKEISIDKKTKITIFKDNVVAIDEENNNIRSNYAEYNKDDKILESKGETIIETSEGYVLTGNDIIFNNAKNYIKSNNPAVIKDLENNNIYLQRFEYFTDQKFFKSNGDIKVIDSNNNSYNFSQIFIDEKNKEILGSDIKSYLNEKTFKVNDDNKPRVFANSVKIKEDETEFTKSIFTMCNYREDDKCPPWSVQAKKMRHDKKKKTIFYNNAVIKIYDIPLFYLPNISHPDPDVKRASGFLPPLFSDNANLGSSVQIPYFWAVDKDKDFTITNRLFASQHPLILGEYRQAFKNSSLTFDFGYTGGYKENTPTKKEGDKSHFYTKFIKTFKGKSESDNNLTVSLQHTSHDKYLKLYEVKSDLIDPDVDVLSNSLDFTHEDENIFLGLEASVHESLKDDYNDKYEYILPDLIVSRNLFSNNRVGSLDFQSNLKLHNYDTNKFEKFLVNDFDWKYSQINFSSGWRGRFIGKVKNVNYEAKNTQASANGLIGTSFKEEPTNELFGALGYLTEVDLFKKVKNTQSHTITPKILFRYAPGHMRKEPGKPRIDKNSIFTLDRTPSFNNFESGASSTIGFQYKINDEDKSNFDFSLGQIVNAKENKKMPSSTSLDEKLSDVVGNASYNILDKDGFSPVKFTYDFRLDQNYKDLNYNQIKSEFNLNPVKFDFGYLQEKKHYDNQEYFTTNLEYSRNENTMFSFSTKRNLITHSSEYYNLSYEYLNDCLRAGIVYRREFYTDSELEPENSLMFRITLTPFGSVDSPSFAQ